MPTSQNHQYALMSRFISSQKNNGNSRMRGVVTASHDNIMPGFRMLAFKSMQVGCIFLKVASFFKNPILRKFKLTHSFKTVQKSCLENFQINMKIN